MAGKKGKGGAKSGSGSRPGRRKSKSTGVVLGGWDSITLMPLDFAKWRLSHGTDSGGNRSNLHPVLEPIPVQGRNCRLSVKVTLVQGELQATLSCIPISGCPVGQTCKLYHIAADGSMTPVSDPSSISLDQIGDYDCLCG
ncbi:MAG: hypothetical protein OEY28_05425 [Nitrospira sp.]|nr:hypothetical protein [Nitrospira sp.]